MRKRKRAKDGRAKGRAFRLAKDQGRREGMPSTKGVYYDLLSQQPPLTPQQLRERRVALMRAIQQRRGRPLVLYGTNGAVSERRIPAFMNREDLIPLSEVLDSVEGKAVDILIETPGGFAEVAVEIVNLLRPRFDHVGFIVPHMAMSAGTILVMSGDEILMDNRSSLGPIDPQFVDSDRRPQPAQAILSGIESIKKEIDANNGQLHPVYIPILRNIDPGRLQSARNASELSRVLVTDWLARYKFRDWKVRGSNGERVTDELRKERAGKIASDLCDHQRWLSHGRPLKISDLEEMRVRITDYGKETDLQKLIWELWVNLSHVFAGTNVYKVYESESVDLAKIALVQPSGPGAPAQAGKVLVDVKCQKCGTLRKIQANFGVEQPLEPGAEKFPANCVITCKGCGSVIDLTGLKLQLEAQVKKPVIIQ
jgi:hypothetical protein